MLTLNERLIARGTHVRHPDGLGVIHISLAPKPTRSSNCDEFGFQLHKGNPVWMD